MSKKCTALSREAHFEVKMPRAPHVRATFGRSDVEQVHGVVARSTFPGQNEKSTTCSDRFWTFRFRFAWQAQGQGIVHLVRRICKDVAGAVQETCSSELLGGPGADFLREVTFWSIFRFAEMILRDRCSTSYDLASAVSSAHNFPFLKKVSQNCFVFDAVNFEK